MLGLDASYNSGRELHPSQPRPPADEEDRGNTLTSAHLQRDLCKLQGCARLRDLEATLVRQGRWHQTDRLL